MTKDQFLSKYNPTHSLGLALKSAFNASIKGNKFYTRQLKIAQKRDINSHWGTKLQEIASRVDDLHDFDRYNQEILDLKSYMVDKFSDVIDFRIYHSQKSIAIYLKHLWCLGLINTPPLCHVDRRVMEFIGTPKRLLNLTSIDTIEDYMARMNYIIECARIDRFDSIAEWELEIVE